MKRTRLEAEMESPKVRACFGEAEKQLLTSLPSSFASQTPPLFEIRWREGSLVNRVDFSVTAKEFGRRFGMKIRPYVNCEYRCYSLEDGE